MDKGADIGIIPEVLRSLATFMFWPSIDLSTGLIHQPGGTPSFTVQDGFQAIHAASQGGNLDLVKILLIRDGQCVKAVTKVSFNESSSNCKSR